MQYVLFFILLVLGAAIAQSETGDIQEDGYHTETHVNGNEEEVTILNKDGHVVGKVEVFEDEGYQIDKPIDGEEHLCLLRTIDETDEETDETNVCYLRRTISHEQASGLNMSRILDHCGNRSIYILEPQDCNRIDNTETGMTRRKRSWPVGNYCCHYKKYTTATCTRKVFTSNCCRRFILCLSRCKKCVQYSYKSIIEKLCHHG